MQKLNAFTPSTWISGLALLVVLAEPHAALAQTTGRQTAEVKPSTQEYTLGPDDVLAVVYWGDKDLSAEVVVRPDGFISLPLLNDVAALGLTPTQLAERIARLAAVYLEEPAVTVVVKAINSRKVFITGEVGKPGQYQLGGPTTVLQLIAMAGGLTPFAKTETIAIIRSGANGPVTFTFNYKKAARLEDLDSNIVLMPGDTVIVS